MAKETTTADTGPATATDVGKAATGTSGLEAPAGTNPGALPADTTKSGDEATAKVGVSATNAPAPVAAQTGAAGTPEAATLAAGGTSTTAQDTAGITPAVEPSRPSLEAFRGRIAGVEGRSAALIDQFDLSPLSVGSDAIRELATLVYELAATIKATVPDED